MVLHWNLAQRDPGTLDGSRIKFSGIPILDRAKPNSDLRLGRQVAAHTCNKAAEKATVTRCSCQAALRASGLGTATRC
jgi:hypothetical protein